MALNRWYIGIEFLKCPPSQWGVFRPTIFFICMKITDYGEPYKLDGRPQKKKGGWKEWRCPIGIHFSIERY